MLRIAKDDKVKQPDGTWKQRVEVCNDGDADEEVIVNSYPYDGDSKKTAEKRKWDPADTGENGKPKATAAGRTIKKGKCETFTFEWKGEPKFTYTDVWHKTAGEWKWADGTNLKPLSARNLPPLNPPQQYACVVLPLPYPTLLETVYDQPIDIAITGVELPPGWRIAFMTPAQGDRVTLEPRQKEFQAIMVLSLPDPPLAAPPGGGSIPRAAASLTWAVQPARGLDPWLPFERTLRTVFVSDLGAPRLTQRLERTGNRVTLIVNATDPGGIHELPLLTVGRKNRSAEVIASRVIPLRKIVAVDDESAIGITRATYAIDLQWSEIRGSVLTVTLADQFGNLGRLEKKVP